MECAEDDFDGTLFNGDSVPAGENDDTSWECVGLSEQTDSAVQ